MSRDIFLKSPASLLSMYVGSIRLQMHKRSSIYVVEVLLFKEVGLALNVSWISMTARCR
jgi:hypothetical protein